jgi:hypothetical protein
MLMADIDQDFALEYFITHAPKESSYPAMHV